MVFVFKQNHLINVHSFMLDIRINACGVKCKSHHYSVVLLTTENSIGVEYFVIKKLWRLLKKMSFWLLLVAITRA